MAVRVLDERGSQDERRGVSEGYLTGRAANQVKKISAAMAAAVIPFDEIVPGASVRFTCIDGKQYMSIRDIIMHMCGKDNHRAAEVWRNIPEINKNELAPDCNNFQFPGVGQSKQPVINFPGALKLSMFLPGTGSVLVAMLTKKSSSSCQPQCW